MQPSIQIVGVAVMVRPRTHNAHCGCTEQARGVPIQSCITDTSVDGGAGGFCREVARVGWEVIDPVNSAGS
jgi:hypothetical protein